MGFLDELKHKAGELGTKAKRGFDSAKDKAGNLIEDGKGDDHAKNSPDDAPPGSGDTKGEDPGASTGIIKDHPATASESLTDSSGSGVDLGTTQGAVDTSPDPSSPVSVETGLPEDFAADAPSPSSPNTGLSSESETDDTLPIDLEDAAPSGVEMDTVGLKETPGQIMDSGQVDAETLDGDPDSTISSP